MPLQYSRGSVILSVVLGTGQSYSYATQNKINTPCCLICTVSVFVGFLQTQYAETDGIPLFARRSLSCNASQS